MTKSKNPMAGGFIIAIAIMIGATWGARHAQPTIGLLIGLGIGAVLATILWLFDRRR